MIELSVHLAQDRETQRWFIARSDIPGLWLEAATAPALMERIAAAAPELIELNAEEIFGRSPGGDKDSYRSCL
jgi:hypothetical protein